MPPKKRESKDQVTSQQPMSTTTKETASSAAAAADEKSKLKKKPPIALWVEWTDQDILNEKWDNGKKEKDRGPRSPPSTASYFEDAEGKIDLPGQLKTRVHSWKRPSEVISCDDATEGKGPTVIDANFVNERHIDLLHPNEHIANCELIRHIISVLTSLYEVFSVPSDCASGSSIFRMKQSTSKEKGGGGTTSKQQQNDTLDEVGWKPWHQIWPKEPAKGTPVPTHNPQGKYAVKLYWMGCFRKIIIDDTIPCDEAGNALLPFTVRGNELWPLLLSKALIKVASLDYYGGLAKSEFGDSNMIHCLTGWIPESIPLERSNADKIWEFLGSLLPAWKRPPPPSPTDESGGGGLEGKDSSGEFPAHASNASLRAKSSGDKHEGKQDKKSKDESTTKAGKDDKTKTKPDNNKHDKEKTTAATKEKVSPNGGTSAVPPGTPAKTEVFHAPEYLLYASFMNPPPSYPICKFTDYKQTANTSEKLRQFGLCHYHSHPVHLKTIRTCPLVLPPPPVEVPRWKLVRQKKTRQIVEPKLNPEKHVPKEPKFLEMESPFFKYNVIRTVDERPVVASTISEEVLNVEDMSLNDKDNEKRIPPHVYTELQNSMANLSVSMLRDSNETKRKNSSHQTLGERSDSTSSVKQARESNQGSSRRVSLAVEALKSDTEFDNWMEFDDFLQCFSTLWVYHKPKQHTKKVSDIKIHAQRFDKQRKSTAHTNDTRGISSQGSGVFGTFPSDSSLPFLLFDTLEKSEVLIQFSSLSRWFDPNIELRLEEEVNNNNILEDEDAALRRLLTPVPGTLVVEPYFWKEVITPLPYLNITTTGVKAASLVLPPGRHVLRFMINTPLGYHINVSCANAFIFEDEHSVVQKLTKVSTRFSSYASGVLRQLKDISKSFSSDQTVSRSSSSSLKPFLIGLEDQTGEVRKQYFEMFHSSLASVLKSDLGNNYQPAMAFALNALRLNSNLHVPKVKEKKAVLASSKSAAVAQAPCCQEVVDKKKMTATFSLPAMVHLKGSMVHESAATRLQATFKGYYVRKLMMAHKLERKENKIVNEMLDKIWAFVEPNFESFAVKLYMNMFERKPRLYRIFPFYADQSNNINFCDYNGSYPEAPNASSWFLLFREVFYVSEANLVYLKFYAGIQTLQLKIIDNDTAAEMKTLFFRPVPQILKPNKLGYTFLAASWTNNPVPSGKFRLRLMGENTSLPTPSNKGSVNTAFLTKEIRDYYIPNRYNRVCRQKVTVTEDVLASIYFATSKEDVYVKVQILSSDEKVLCCYEGRGTLIIPAIIFHKECATVVEGDSKSGKSSPTDDSLSSSGGGGKGNSSPTLSSAKYVLEVFVLRDSWPLTKKEWLFVENQKDSERIDEETSTESVSAGGKGERGSSGKKGKGNRQDSRSQKSRPPSAPATNVDATKANWTLRVVVDAIVENAIEIKRDVQREEEIKAIKAAWEIVEPGRARKALKCRRKYLKEHTVVQNMLEGAVVTSEDVVGGEDGAGVGKVGDEENVIQAVKSSESPSIQSESDNGELFIEPPMKENMAVLRKFNTMSYLRSQDKKTLLDEHEEEYQQAALRRKFANFNETRSNILQKREENRNFRNLMKTKQLAEYDEMQIKLDESRGQVYEARDKYRKQFLPTKSHHHNSHDDMSRLRTPSPKLKVKPSKMKKK